MHKEPAWQRMRPELKQFRRADESEQVFRVRASRLITQKCPGFSGRISRANQLSGTKDIVRQQIRVCVCVQPVAVSVIGPAENNSMRCIQIARVQ